MRISLTHLLLFPGGGECDATPQHKRGCADVWMPCFGLRATEGRSAAAERHGGDETHIQKVITDRTYVVFTKTTYVLSVMTLKSYKKNKQ